MASPHQNGQSSVSPPTTVVASPPESDSRRYPQHGNHGWHSSTIAQQQAARADGTRHSSFLVVNINKFQEQTTVDPTAYLYNGDYCTMLEFEDP